MQTQRLTLGWHVLGKIGIRKSTVKTVTYHLRLAFGFLLAAVTIAVMPEGAERAAIVQAIKPYEWLAGQEFHQ